MRRLSYPLSVLLFGPLAFFFGPLPGGQVHLILDLPPSAKWLQVADISKIKLRTSCAHNAYFSEFLVVLINFQEF